jgi:hypothetical protein
MRITLPDGITEVEAIAKLALPLPLSHAGDLLGAIGRAAEKIGYTDVSLLHDGEYAGYIVGTPPAPG